MAEEEHLTLEQLLTARTNTEFAYKAKKKELEEKEFDFILNVNWNEINEERLEEDLPKISNEKMRNAYIKIKFASLREDMEALEVQLNHLNILLKFIDKESKE